MTDPLLATEEVHGPDPDLYRILAVPRNATTTQIREAYFCLRYAIYQQLSGCSEEASSADRRTALESKMEALTGAFRILTDPARKIPYDASLNREEGEEGGATFPPVRGEVGRANRSVFRRKGSTRVNPDSSETKTKSRSLARKLEAETVTSFRKKNVERGSADSKLSHGSVFGEDSANGRSTSSKSSYHANGNKSHLDSIFGGTDGESKSTVRSSNFDRTSYNRNRNHPSSSEEIDEDVSSGLLDPSSSVENDSNFASFPPVMATYQERPLPLGVNHLNIREQMLYKNQMRLRSSQTDVNNNVASSSSSRGGGVVVEKSRIASRYEAEERSDWLVENEEEEEDEEEELSRRGEEAPTDDDEESRASRKKRWFLFRKQKAASPTSVEEFDSADTFKEKGGGGGKSSAKRSASAKTASMFRFDDASSYRDDDTRTYDDDETTYYDDTTAGDTLEETTLGESCVSDDDETYTSDVKKYSPSHKKGNRPEPILRSGRGGSNGKFDESRRVVVHSHRGRRGKGEDEDLADSMCPFPSLTEIKEEVRGTCKDASSAFHQVLHAFVISPDDIDRMSDKIRDAGVELAENYHRQVKERKRNSTGGRGRDIRL